MPPVTEARKGGQNATFKDKEKPVMVRESNITAAKGLYSAIEMSK